MSEATTVKCEKNSPLFERLPPEIFGLVGGYLRYNEVISLYGVSKIFFTNFKSDYVWKQLTTLHRIEGYDFCLNESYFEQFKANFKTEKELRESFLNLDFKPYLNRGNGFSLSFSSFSIEEVEDMGLLKVKDGKYVDTKKITWQQRRNEVKVVEDCKVSSKDVILLDTMIVKKLKRPSNGLKIRSDVFGKNEILFQVTGDQQNEEKRLQTVWKKLDEEDYKQIFDECFSNFGCVGDYESKVVIQKFHIEHFMYSILADQKFVDEMLNNIFLKLRTENSRLYFGADFLLFPDSSTAYTFRAGRDEMIALITNTRVYCIFIYFERYWC